MNDSRIDRPLFSFVMPLRDMSDCAEYCLDSILEQSYGRVEVIVVGDVSDYRALEATGKYSKEDPRIRFVPLGDNASVHSARCKGVMASLGDYVWIVDGRKEISPDTCEVLTGILVESPADIVHVGTEIAFDDGPSPVAECAHDFAPPYDGPLEGHDVLAECFAKKSYGFDMWNKIFEGSLCRKAFESMTHEGLPAGEDEYEYFVLAHYAESYIGVRKRYCCTIRNECGMGRCPPEDGGFAGRCAMAAAMDEILAFSKRASFLGELDPILEKMERRHLDECYGSWSNNVPWEMKGAGLDLMIDCWGASRAIGLIASRNWNDQVRIARIAASSKHMALHGGDVKTVAVFYHGLGEGEIQRTVSCLIDIWASIGYEIVLITDNPPAENERLPDGVVHETIPPTRDTNANNYGERSKALSDILLAHSADALVYHAWSSYILIWDLLTCKSCGVRFVLHCHGAFSEPVKDLRKQFAYQQPIGNLCDAIVVPDGVDWAYWSNFNSNVHEVIDPLPFRPREVAASKLDNCTVFWVGSASREERPWDAPKVMKIVLAEVPVSKLVMVCDGNENARRSLLKQMDGLGIRDRVTLITSTRNAEPLYQRASLLLNTSESEDCTGVILKAMSAGVPVVSYEIPILMDLGSDAGVVQVPRGDVRSAALEVARILRDGIRRHNLGNQARDCVMKIGSFDVGMAWDSIFEGLTEGHVPTQNNNANGAMWRAVSDCYLDGIRNNNISAEETAKKLKAESERKRAESERKRAESERKRAESERKRAESERKKAEGEKIEMSLSSPESYSRIARPFNRPIVTIVVKVSGGFECTLDSVLDQTFRDWKCVAVTDSDPSMLLARYGQFGIAATSSMENAISAAKTPYTMVMDTSVMLNCRFVGSALDRLKASHRSSLSFAPVEPAYTGPLTSSDLEDKVVVLKSGQEAAKNAVCIRTSLVHRANGLPSGSSGLGILERGAEISFTLDCSECDPSVAECFLDSMPGWAELVCHDVPEDASFQCLRRRWADYRLKIMNGSGDTPLHVIAECCTSHNIMIVDPTHPECTHEFFDTALKASKAEGRMVTNSPGLRRRDNSAENENLTFDPHSTIFRRSEITADGFNRLMGDVKTTSADACPEPDPSRNSQDCGATATKGSDATKFMVVCPVCGGVFEHMLQGEDGRMRAKCPNCDSMERHRAVDILMRRTVRTKLASPTTLYVNPPSRMAPHLAARGIDCRSLDEISEDAWVYDAVVCCHQLQRSEDHAALINMLKSKLSKCGTLYITVPLKRVYGRAYMVERIKTEVFDLADEIASYGMEPELVWIRDSFSPVTANVYSAGEGAVIVCRTRATMRCRGKTPHDGTGKLPPSTTGLMPALNASEHLINIARPFPESKGRRRAPLEMP